MSGQETRDRILDAAETLFVTHGFAKTSIRAVTQQAGVNVAAVHYHFGSKDDLIREVLLRRIEPVNRERLRLLDACLDSAEPPSLECIVNAFIEPAVRLGGDDSPAGAVIPRLLGRIHSEPGEAFHQALVELFAETKRRFSIALSRALPGLSPTDLIWRLNFLVGALAHSIGAPHLLRHISNGLCDPAETETTRRQLLAFVCAGLRAPSIEARDTSPSEEIEP